MLVDKKQLSLARAVWRPDPMLFGYYNLSTTIIVYLYIFPLYLQCHGISVYVCATV